MPAVELNPSAENKDLSSALVKVAAMLKGAIRIMRKNENQRNRPNTRMPVTHTWKIAAAGEALSEGDWYCSGVRARFGLGRFILADGFVSGFFCLTFDVLRRERLKRKMESD